MIYTKSELEVLKEIACGKNSIELITMNLSKKQLYKIINSLIRKDTIQKENHQLKPNNLPHVKLLSKILSENPNIILILADCGIAILTSLIESKSLNEIKQETLLKKSIIYRKLKMMLNTSMIFKKKKYQINEKIWPVLKDYIIQLINYERLIDKNLPYDSIIYLKNKKEIIYSTSSKDSLGSKTAFSKYEDFGIKLLLTKNYFYLPTKKLSEKNILLHTLIICKKEKTIQNLIFLSLFYLKFKEKFKSVNDEILFNIDKVLQGSKLHGYPTKEEILQRVKLYNIKA